ncbi:glycosyltransferase family 4 protein [Sphingobium phenoxybenzoativorans]|uniref:glycosyltransferase family 4 protein n=1 Tax=Sphingobium phenoxybenzoativorans TaxID=1592790 RepID=UPI0014954AE6|nr:glycosyltransferase family 4 protein [Sphingobium phenoxybenzoativorans]
MRVCVVGLRALPSTIGGIETYCEMLYPHMVDEDANLLVTILTRSGYSKERAFNFRSLNVRSIWSPRISGLETAMHTLLAIIYARLTIHPQVIHLHGVGPAFFALFARMLGMKTVVIHHAPDYRRPKWGMVGRWFLKSGERVAAQFADAIICVSDTVRRDFLGLYPSASSRTVAIRAAAALPPPAWNHADEILDELDLHRGRYILSVGRLEATKALEDLIDAFEIASPLGMKLVIAGSGIGDERYAQKLIERASDKIVFAGPRYGSALRTLYTEAALFVHPSHMEGFALVVAEALSVRLPVILSDIEPHREFKLRDNCYFRRGDVHQLARLLAMDSYESFYSREQCEIQSAKSWTHVAQEHLSVLAGLSRERKRAPSQPDFTVNSRHSDISSNTDQ